MKPWHKDPLFLAVSGLVIAMLIAGPWSLKRHRDREEASLLLQSARCALRAFGGAGAFDNSDIICEHSQPEVQAMSLAQRNATLQGIARDLAHSASLSPNSDAYYFLGVAYVLMPDFTNALDAYRKAVANGSDRITAAIGIAGILIDQGRYDEAREAIARLESFSPDGLRVAQTYSLILHIKQRDVTGVEQDAARLLEMDPADPTGIAAKWLLFRVREQDAEAATWRAQMTVGNSKAEEAIAEWQKVLDQWRQ